jgi:hypothetical protein
MNRSTGSSARGGALSSVSNSRFLCIMVVCSVGNEAATIDTMSISPFTDKIVASSRTKPLKRREIRLNKSENWDGSSNKKSVHINKSSKNIS